MEGWIGRDLGGRYRVERHLGRGGMGEVYVARQLALGREVAVKVLPDADSRAAERFRQEASALAALRHPNIVAIHEFVDATADDPAFIVMELVDGKALADELMQRKTLGVVRAVRIAIQVLAALEASHRAGIIHRDVKPPNVVLVPSAIEGEDVVKLLDFGVAKMRRGVKTTLGTILGTPAYLAPEQITAPETVDARTDVHAVGILLYQMLTGERPWGALRGEAAMEAILHTPAPHVAEKRPDVLPPLDSIVARALEKDPAARFATARDMIAALSATLGPARDLKTTIRATAAIPPKRSRALDVIGLVAALALIAAAFAVHQYRTTQSAGTLTEQPRLPSPIVAPAPSPPPSVVPSPLPTSTDPPPMRTAKAPVVAPPTSSSARVTVAPPPASVSSRVSAPPTDLEAPPTPTGQPTTHERCYCFAPENGTMTRECAGASCRCFAGDRLLCDPAYGYGPGCGYGAGKKTGDVCVGVGPGGKKEAGYFDCDTCGPWFPPAEVPSQPFPCAGSTSLGGSSSPFPYGEWRCSSGKTFPSRKDPREGMKL